MPSIEAQLASGSMGPGWSANDLRARIMWMSQHRSRLDVLLERKTVASPYLTA